ncbi:methyltransferase PMT19 [Spatholobus suberectus]|nr:methyltransferase PMT19 [Spatholobus suberectus]
MHCIICVQHLVVSDDSGSGDDNNDGGGGGNTDGDGCGGADGGGCGGTGGVMVVAVVMVVAKSVVVVTLPVVVAAALVVVIVVVVVAMTILVVMKLVVVEAMLVVVVVVVAVMVVAMLVVVVVVAAMIMVVVVPGDGGGGGGGDGGCRDGGSSSGVVTVVVTMAVVLVVVVARKAIVKYNDVAWFNNVPFPKLTEYKKSQNWVALRGDRFVFPGGGTSFINGVKGYVDAISRLVPLKSGKIRTVLDVGCGVASFGASLMDYNILTMSIAPKDAHEAQVQFALERGLPAMLGVLSHHRLPFPSRSFDMAHCSRCLVRWTAYGGLYLLEIDRVLRPGGYWVLSGPPINWRRSYRGWQMEPKCGKSPSNHIQCIQKLKTWKSPQLCPSSDADADAAWHTKMKACIVPLANVKDINEMSGGALQKWPKRLTAAPPRVRNAMDGGITTRTFNEDNRMWKKRVSHYEVVLKSLAGGNYRNVMDMNAAGFRGFAAAMAKYPVWVMNIVPFDAKNSSLGIIYERGLIGTYMDWCEPFSTYPRTYDLIHASGLFSMYMDKCDITDILIEMHRILRPEGAVIIRDHIDVLVKVKRVINQIRWDGKIFHGGNGPFNQEKVLLVDNSE